MTHSLYFKLETTDYEKVEELKEAISSYEDFMGCFNLITNDNIIEQKNGYQPFIYFPSKDDKEADGKYYVSIETGTHVASYDTVYALHWFHFTLVFKEIFKEELESFRKYYHLEDSDEELLTNQMLKKIKG